MKFFIFSVQLLAKEQEVAPAASARGLKALQKPMTAKEKEEVRIEVEEQLKIQRALANAKRQGLNVPTVAGLNDSPPPSINTKTVQTRGGCISMVQFFSNLKHMFTTGGLRPFNENGSTR